MTYPHPDCAECVHWKDCCLKGKDPRFISVYSKCWWCNTKPKPEAEPVKEAPTGNLFGGD